MLRTGPDRLPPARQQPDRRPPGQLHGQGAQGLASRGTTHQDRARKAELLLERLLALGDQVAADTIQKLRDKLEHQRFRAALPASRLARCVPVLREALTGRYEKFGRGARGVVRDLFESV